MAFKACSTENVFLQSSRKNLEHLIILYFYPITEGLWFWKFHGVLQIGNFAKYNKDLHVTNGQWGTVAISPKSTWVFQRKRGCQPFGPPGIPEPTDHNHKYSLERYISIQVYELNFKMDLNIFHYPIHYNINSPPLFPIIIVSINLN